VAFAQELWHVHNADVRAAVCGKAPLDVIARADGDGRTGHKDAMRGEDAGRIVGGSTHLCKVRLTVRTARRIDTKEHMAIRLSVEAQTESQRAVAPGRFERCSEAWFRFAQVARLKG
jgi:hypothetical protein